MPSFAGNVVTFELNGVGAVSACQEVAQDVNSQSNGLVFVSASAQAAQSQIDNFFNFADLQMNA